MKCNITEIVQEVNDTGICKLHINNMLNDLTNFNNVTDEYNKLISSDKCVNLFNHIKEGRSPTGKVKFFECNQYELYGHGIGVDHPLVKLYLQQEFIDIATEFHGTSPRARNILLWAHPATNTQVRTASQNWHRDQEDYRILKVFINFSHITIESGATEFLKNTQHGGSESHVSRQHFLDDKGRSRAFPPHLVKKLEVADISGEPGTISFVNANGVHRGGLVKAGLRLLTHCNFLHPEAPLILNKTLPVYNYNNNINTLDTSSPEYEQLTDIQRNILK